MPHSSQAKKRLRQDAVIRVKNKAAASRMKTEVKKVLGHIEAGDAAAAEKALPEAFRRIDKAAKRNVIHKNNAAHKKSVLSRGIGRLKQA